jgi:hypothetical protein
MVDMKMSKEEAKEECQPSESQLPRYPYGLELSLDDDAIEKLSLADVSVGDVVTISALAKVTRKSGYETMIGDSETSIGLQITDMEASSSSTKTTKTLYDNN